MRPPIAIAAALGAALFLAGPAVAQSGSEPKVNQLIIYGDDQCPQSTDGEIIICAKKPESERFRIPEILRGTASPQNEAWNNRVIAYETVGRSGTMSCSPTGAGGWTGCAGKLIDAAYAEKDSDPGLKFSELIAAERAKRMATIDTEAAETQARVEAAEREYEARQRAQGTATAPADEPPPPPPARNP